MLGVEAERQTRNPINPRLIALTPRQVVLANPKMGKSLTSTNSNHKDYKAILHHSIARYLQHYGFCKTLKKFRSEVHLQEDYQKNMILDLEEICIKYLETISNAIANAKGVEQVCMNGKGEGEAGSELESLSKKKKKRHEGSGDAAVDNSEPVGKSTTHDEGMANGQAPEKVKSKEKKKNKRLSDSIEATSLEDSKQSVNSVFKSEDLSIKKKEKQNKKSVVVSESQTETVKEQSKASETREVAFSEVDKKSKDKKKRKSKELDQEDDAKTLGEIPEHGEDKGLKKRKRAEPEEDHSMLGDKSASDESKHRKTDSVKEEKSSTQQVKSENSDGGEENNGQDVHASPDTLRKTPSKPLDSEENGNSENGGTSATQRSSKSQHKGSAEPSTVRAFQRIKVEEVKFADERLKDNSYWAKDGAESGYGAKAQGILGQVRGRGFRHEKTKKKRGSYRGGQIDLQSHSVKFNYSDDEE